MPLRKRSTESIVDAVLLFGQLEVCASDMLATMADRIRDEFVRIVQISIYNAHENQAIQRGVYIQ